MLDTFKVVIIFLLMLVVSCKSDSTYSIVGTTDNSLNGEKLYLIRSDIQKAIDSAVIENGNFSFKGKIDTSVYCVLNTAKNHLGNLILEHGKIVADLNSKKITGTLLNDRLSAYSGQKDSIQKKYQADMMRMKEEISDDEELYSARENYYNNVYVPLYQSLLNKTYEENQANEITPIVLKELSYLLTAKQTDSLFNNLSDKYPLNNSGIQSIVKSNQAYLKTDEGKPFSDFTIKTEDGGEISLSKYVGKGKYTLVDFWASWCGPCRAEIPVIAELNNQYKDKGLEILGVAVWDKPEASKKAISDLNMTWNQIINAERIASDVYGIRSIPHIIVFAPDGTIVARGLTGAKLKQKIAELLTTK